MDRLINSLGLRSADANIDSPEQILSRALSTKSHIIPGAPAGADDVDCSDVARVPEIGKGQCGTVYALPTSNASARVVKISNSAEKIPQLLMDFKVHRRILEAMEVVRASGLNMDICVPELHSWAGSDPHSICRHVDLPRQSAWEAEHRDGQTYAIVSSRVHAIPQPVREALVDVLCPSAIAKCRDEFLGKPDNNNCLVRVYLGRRETTKTATHTQNINLRNFPLHVNEMEDLQLNTSWFARIMAQTLAVLHWKAGVDGNDIEFILGRSPPPSTDTTMTDESGGDDDAMALARCLSHHHQCQSLGIWLIDFNQCSMLDDDDAGLKKIVDAFFWNDPYYPLPNSTVAEDKSLWSVFSQRYLEVSRMFTDSQTPGLFIANIEERSAKRTPRELFG